MNQFSSKINGALQEADESQLWIELLKEECGITGAEIDALHCEANELVAILVHSVEEHAPRCRLFSAFQDISVPEFQLRDIYPPRWMSRTACAGLPRISALG